MRPGILAGFHVWAQAKTSPVCFQARSARGSWGSSVMHVEICVDSVESAVAAARGGAERIELCSALNDGGITPSAGLMSAVRGAVSIAVCVIVRPRGGSFVYSDYELEVMRKDILEAKSQGVDGVVLGVLTADADVDRELTRELIQLARPLQVTFHRAFDACRDLDRALEDVIACGADRLLTSGGQADAASGAEQIARLQRRAKERIAIMAGGGVRSSNVRDLVLRTGVREVHTSLGAQVSEGDGELTLGNGQIPRFLVTEEEVRAFRAVLNEIPQTIGTAPLQ